MIATPCRPRRLPVVLGCIAVLFLLAGLPGVSRSAAQSGSGNGTVAAGLDALPLDVARVMLAGRTIMTRDPGHGTQVEYFSPDGFNYLWYPGNTGPVYGVWKLQRDSADRFHELCFRYQSNSYNPLTRQRGGDWECQPYRPYVSNFVETRVGDIFGLESGELPHRLARRATSFDELLAQRRPPPSR
jgi:hypothetical protein